MVPPITTGRLRSVENYEAVYITRVGFYQTAGRPPAMGSHLAFSSQSLDVGGNAL